MTEACPHCWTTPALDGSCCCEQPVKPPPAPTPARALRQLDLDVHREEEPAVKPEPLRAKEGTAGQLADLPDIVAHLALRLTSSAPGAEHGGGRREAAHVAPVNVGVLQILDDRRRHGDDILTRRDDERWRCQHHSHSPADCPHADTEDDAGGQGVVADLETWADWISGDLEQWHPQLPEEVPDDSTLAGLCDWLARHYPRWQELLDSGLSDESHQLVARAIDQFERDVRRWHTALRRELGETDPVPLRHANLGGCGGRLLPLTDGIRHECVECHEVLTPGEMLGLARWQSDVTLAEAAEVLGLSVDRVRQWVKRDPTFPRPVDNSYPARYLLRDVRAYAEQRGALRVRA